jgi:hypothetical protein
MFFFLNHPEHLMHLQVRRLLFVFLARPSEDHEFLNPLLALGRTPTDCYIGLCRLEGHMGRMVGCKLG